MYEKKKRSITFYLIAQNSHRVAVRSSQLGTDQVTEALIRGSPFSVDPSSGEKRKHGEVPVCTYFVYYGSREMRID